MSDLRKERQELRQGLHQFLMQLYMNYKASLDEKRAKELVSSAIEEQYEYFIGGKVSTNSVKDVIESRVKELEAMMKEQSDYDGQLFYSEQIDTLQRALEILDQ